LGGVARRPRGPDRLRAAHVANLVHTHRRKVSVRPALARSAAARASPPGAVPARRAAATVRGALPVRRAVGPPAGRRTRRPTSLGGSTGAVLRLLLADGRDPLLAGHLQRRLGTRAVREAL